MRIRHPTHESAVWVRATRGHALALFTAALALGCSTASAPDQPSGGRAGSAGAANVGPSGGSAGTGGTANNAGSPDAASAGAGSVASDAAERKPADAGQNDDASLDTATIGQVIRLESGTVPQPAAGDGSAATPPDGSAPLLPGSWGDQGDGTFRNPVLFADYNNLDVIAAGSDFYMVAASHHFMGMPVLRSHDLVNWTLVSRIYRALALDPRYGQPGQAYQHGTWAPSIRYHEGRFWVYVATPAEGLLMTTATDAAGPWAPFTVVRKVAGWEDPCPFWDDVDNAGGDGPNGRRAYLIRSQLGAGPLIVQPMRWDGTALLGTATTVATGPTLEGPKLHKRGGSYYIFAPEGGIDAGYQVVLRSANILGPYTKRTILARGATAINGPHQGSWIDLPSGESWFYHFQQSGGFGRVAHLQPARWAADGWPSIGADPDGDGIGEPVARPNKPQVGGAFGLAVPQSSDEFDAAALGLQWLWNHNPDDSKWSLGARPGWLRLGARPLASASGTNGADGASVPFVEDSIVFAYNTLVQLAMGRLDSAITKLDTTGMVDGQRAGITLFGQTYGWIGVVQASGRRTIRANLNGRVTDGPALGGAVVFLQARLDASSQISFAYSADGASYTPLGATLTVGRTWFEGIKFGLFTYVLSAAAAGGVADFDFFRYSHDGPHPAP